MKYLVTGGAGFIGSTLIKQLLKKHNNIVINIDKLGYASNLDSLKSVESNPKYYFEKTDICNERNLSKIFKKHEPDRIIHLAAESHVDRSIDAPAVFIQNNIIGTYVLLNQSYKYFQEIKNSKRKKFLFHHVSTDEVYGSLTLDDTPFDENNRYEPSSPYSASKASSDHLVRSWNQTFKLPTIITNCSNNYGPYQFPEKLIPLTIYKAVNLQNIPIYGKGDQIRDWLYVEDHAEALIKVNLKGNDGETYNIGGNCEMTNLDIVEHICFELDKLRPINDKYINKHSDLITFVKDRPGHDYRYAMNIDKIKNKIGWKPKVKFEVGINKTIKWYLKNLNWYENNQNYKGERLGLIK